jgi:hypothetical protein
MSKKRNQTSQSKSNTKTLSSASNQSIESITMANVSQQWQKFFDGKDLGNKATALGYAYTSSPYVQNQRAKRVSSQPFTKDRANIEQALAKPNENEQSLREVSSSLFSIYPLLKLNNMYADILTYRNYFYSKYTNSKDIKSKEYKQERKMLSKWVDLLQPKRTFQQIVLKVQREGKVAYYLRDSKVENSKDFDYVYLQDIPSDYFKIIGWNTASKFTVSFNFTYFWQMGTSPMQFPPIFKKYYDELNGLVKDKNNPVVNPNKLPADAEMYYQDNKWFYWHTLPMDECFVFSQDESQIYQIPNSIGLFLQAKDLQDYSYLQQELLQLPLSGVVMGTLPMTKDSNGTISTDNYAMGTEAFSFFTNMFNEVAPKGTQLFLTPAQDYKFFKFDDNVVNNSSIVTNALQQFNSIAGVGGLNSTTDKPNVAQVKTQQVLESAYVEKMYEQFKNCINTWWENKLKLKFEWRFKIKGSRFIDENDFSKVEKGLTTGQNYLLPEYLSYFDLTIDDIQSIQEEVAESKVYDKLQVLQSAFNSNQSISVKTGRPIANENDIKSDSTDASIGQGTNTADGRDVMSLNYCVECGGELTNKDFSPFCSKECMEENEGRLNGSN